MDPDLAVPLAHAAHVIVDTAFFLVPVGSILLTIFVLRRWGPKDN
ncbi:MAG TPA: hypothetical protein VKA41_10495 [Solirubrobacterales bacterium]|nr:hypothetical protein [Solirubrobacterales bacterium]